MSTPSMFTTGKDQSLIAVNRHDGQALCEAPSAANTVAMLGIVVSGRKYNLIAVNRHDGQALRYSAFGGTPVGREAQHLQRCEKSRRASPLRSAFGGTPVGRETMRYLRCK